jgi:VanZ family protein
MPGTPPSNRFTIAAWVLWWLALAVLTYGLVSPDPPKAGAAVIPSELTLVVSKTVHIVAYAVLAAGIFWLTSGPRLRLALALLLVAHGAFTEYLQTFVEGRYGSVTDVFIDTAGVILGCLLGWALRRSR